MKFEKKKEGKKETYILTYMEIYQTLVFSSSSLSKTDTSALINSSIGSVLINASSSSDTRIIGYN